MTVAERALWHCLRRKQLDGYRFRRQHPIGRFVLDFYCPALKLAVELDGAQHYSVDGKASDSERSAWLQTQGIQVLRFLNQEVFEDMDNVIKAIRNKIQEI